MKRKAQFLGITFGMLIVVSIIIALLLFGGSFFIFILGQNLFRLIGAVLLILVTITFLIGKRFPGKTGMTLIIIGAILVLLPFFADIFANVTLAAVIR